MSQQLVRSDSMYSDLSKEVEMLWDQRLQEVYEEFTHANIHYHSTSFPVLAPEITNNDDRLRAQIELDLASFESTLFQPGPVDVTLHSSVYYEDEDKNAQYKATWDLREPGTEEREEETRPQDDIYGARLDLTKSGTSTTTDDANSDYQSCASNLSTQTLQDLDSDLTLPAKVNQPKNGKRVSVSGNRAAGQNPNMDVLFVSACVDLLFTGKDAAHLLDCVLRHFNEKPGNRSFPVIKVKGESVISQQGISLQAHINATILNTCHSTPVFILILENFSEEQVCYLYESGFVREVMQAPYRRAHVIFLSPLNLKNLNKIASYGPKVVKADFAEWLLAGKSKANNQSSYDGGPIITELEAESVGSTPESVLMTESRNNNNVPAAIHYQPISTLFEEKIKMALLNSELLESKSRHSDGAMAGNADAPQRPPPTEVEVLGGGDKPKEKVAKGKCMDWCCGIFNVVSTLLAQCGDCCFY